MLKKPFDFQPILPILISKSIKYKSIMFKTALNSKYMYENN